MRNIFTVFGICLAVSAFAYEGTDLQSTDTGTDEYFEKIMEQVCPDTLDIAKEIQEEQGISLQETYKEESLQIYKRLLEKQYGKEQQ